MDLPAVPGLAGPALAQEADKIVKIEVVGNERIERGVVANALKIKELETYDPEKINDLQIAMKLDEAGYLGEWTMPIEAGATAYHAAAGLKPYFRHTAAYDQTRLTVSFAQNVAYLGRPLWPCPGLGIISKPMEE